MDLVFANINVVEERINPALATWPSALRTLAHFEEHIQDSLPAQAHLARGAISRYFIFQVGVGGIFENRAFCR